MKKLLLLFIGITALSCSSDDADAVQCNCDEAVFVSGLSEDPQPVGTYSVEMDCETGKPKYNPTGDPNAWFLECNDE